MAAAVPKTFWSSPIRYLRWAAHEKPAIFWSFVVGGLGPVSVAVVPTLRRYVGDEDPARIPLTYPGELGRNLSCVALERRAWMWADKENDMGNPSRKPVANGSVLTVPKGPRKIPQGFDDPE